MNNKETNVLVIIVSYNGIKHIENCLTLMNPTFKGINYLVIDNASEDDTVNFIKKNYPYIKIIENTNNLGFGAANNIGLRYAVANGYEYVYLINQDAWISPSSILKLVEIAETHVEYGIISPMQYYANKKELDYNFLHALPIEIRKNFYSRNKTLNEIYDTRGGTIPAAHWLIRTESLIKVGGFSPTFFHYGEDDNLVNRMVYHGYKVGIVPHISAVHNREGRFSNRSKEMHLILTRWKKIVANPNLTILSVLNGISKKIIIDGKILRVKIFPLLNKFIFSLPSQIYNRNISKYKRGAFLL